MKYYPIEQGYSLTEEDVEVLGAELKDITIWGKKVCSLSDIDGDVVVMAKKKIYCYNNNDITDPIYSISCPRVGEWFISGAEPEAYRSTCDLSTSFHLAELVLVKTITITSRELEHNIWKELQLEQLKNTCSIYADSRENDKPNEDMQLNVAFQTVLTLAALFAKELCLEHGGPETVDDANFIIALEKVTNLACYMYDKPFTYDIEGEIA